MARVRIDRRIHPDQIIRLNIDSIKAQNKALVEDQLRRFGVDATEDDFERHSLLPSFLKNRELSPDAEFLAWAEHWLTTLRKTNAANAHYAQ